MDQRVYLLTSTAFAAISAALILSLLAVGVDLGYDRWRIHREAPAAGAPLVVPGPARSTREVARAPEGGGDARDSVRAVGQVVAAPSPVPEAVAQPPRRSRERRTEERARRLRRPGGSTPSVPAPAPAPAPVALQPVATAAASGGTGGGDHDDAARGREGEGQQAAREQGSDRGLQRALGRRAAEPSGHAAASDHPHPARDKGVGRVDDEYGGQLAQPPGHGRHDGRSRGRRGPRS